MRHLPHQGTFPQVGGLGEGACENRESKALCEFLKHVPAQIFACFSSARFGPCATLREEMCAFSQKHIVGEQIS
jgi:hypothetical protein